MAAKHNPRYAQKKAKKSPLPLLIGIAALVVLAAVLLVIFLPSGDAPQQVIGDDPLFASGLMPVMQENLWGFADSTGNIAIQIGRAHV